MVRVFVLAAEEKLEVYLNQKLGSVLHVVSFIVRGAALKLGYSSKSLRALTV